MTSSRAASRLRETVAVITRLEEVREKKENIFNRPIGLKIKEKELALICSQFAIILSAGMSIQHCVEMVAAQTRNRHIRQMLEKVAEEVGAGYSMAQSFENNAPYLPKTFIETVRAGEQSGTLEECFGTGTAAVISPVGKLRYKDDVMTICGGQIGPLSQKLYDIKMDLLKHQGK